jgi:hypothetical protein
MAKTICKRVLSTILVMIFVFTTFCFADLGLFASANISVTPIETQGRPDVQFYVPEAIYTTASGTYQYYVDCDSAGNLSADPAKTEGTVYFRSSAKYDSLVIKRDDGVGNIGPSGGGSSWTGTVNTSGTPKTYTMSGTT